MNKDCNDFLILCEKIDDMMVNNNGLVVAIDGPCAGGKSSLANSLGEYFDANIFHIDDYFLTPGLRTENRLKEPGGNIDYVRFRKEVILGIKGKKSFTYFKYNCKSDSMEIKKVNGPKPLTVIEGSYSLHPYLREAYGLKVFLTIEPETQRRRILKRNGPDIARRFFNEWIPMEELYFEGFSVKEEADVVLDGSLLDKGL